MTDRAREIAEKVCGGPPERCWGWKAKIYNAAYEAAEQALDEAFEKQHGQIISNAVAQVAADALRRSFPTSVSDGQGRYYLSYAYRTMEDMHRAEDQIVMFLREPQFLPLKDRLLLKRRRDVVDAEQDR